MRWWRVCAFSVGAEWTRFLGISTDKNMRGGVKPFFFSAFPQKVALCGHIAIRTFSFILVCGTHSETCPRILDTPFMYVFVTNWNAILDTLFMYVFARNWNAILDTSFMYVFVTNWNGILDTPFMYVFVTNWNGILDTPFMYVFVTNWNAILDTPFMYVFVRNWNAIYPFKTFHFFCLIHAPYYLQRTEFSHVYPPT